MAVITILVVDDTRVDAQLLQRRLDRRGFEVSVAFSGSDGVEAARRQMPDCILMDLQMPFVSGLDAIRMLKEDPATAAIPIVALSSYAGYGTHRQDALDAGAFDYIARPPDLEQLVAAIRSGIDARKPAHADQ
jgi:two-component system cell cycle response regulator DivK